MEDKKVKIGCSSAFWGDSMTGAHQLTHFGDIDYLVGDYLAEVTMGILARSRKKARGQAGKGGYVGEFVKTICKPLMKDWINKGIKVVTNAGGLNPVGCKESIEELAIELGIDIKVAAVFGDDLMPRVNDMKTQGKILPFSVGGEKEPYPKGKKKMSFNAYLGALPIVDALQNGAQIIVTGRCVDSALVLGPLMYEFGWSSEQYDLLSCGSLTGHIIECACQATGGNFTDWKKSASKGSGWENVGFPIAECNSDGSFVISKPPGTGGLVSVGTVSEQMLYEIHNPGAYILPDVTCDWRNVSITQVGDDRVLVHGARGIPPTPFYKISATFFDGYKLGAMLTIGGIDAREKAEYVGKAILARSRRLLQFKGLSDFDNVEIEILGSEHTYGPHATSGARKSREVLLRIVVHHQDMMALGLFGREIAPSATAMAPGITGGGVGRPRPQPLIVHYSALTQKENVPASVHVGTTYKKTGAFYSNKHLLRTLPVDNAYKIQNIEPLMFPKNIEMIEVPLIELCFGRSGDKGDVVNIGLIARKPEFYPFIKSVITEEKVATYMAHLISGRVQRFELPGVYALNFVCTHALGGGGLSSLRSDRQGKAHAQMLLSYKVRVPKRWIRDGYSSL